MIIRIFTWEENNWWRGMVVYTCEHNHVHGIVDIGAFADKDALDAVVNQYVEQYLEETKL